jgi:hypothetical protein
LEGALPIRPLALDEVQFGGDFIVSEHPPEGEHVSGVTRRNDGKPIPNDLHELPIRMVPGVARLVMRWSWQFAVGLSLHPIWLSFELGTVTAGASIHVESPAVERSCCGWQRGHKYGPKDTQTK